MEKAGAGLAAGGLGRARVLWFRVQQGLMSRFQRVEPKVSCPGFTIRFKCTGYRVLGSGSGVLSLGFRDKGLGFRVYGLGFRV